MAPRGIVIEIVGDDRSYIRAAERTIAANKSIGASNTFLTRNTEANTSAQIAARVKAQAALEASIIGLSAKASALPAGSRAQAAAVALQAEEQAKLNRLLGVSTLSTRQFGNSAKTAERDLNKMTRGVLSGSGILGRFSRSLAFASTGFIAFATAAEVVKESITSAEDLEKADRSLAAAIKHTGGNLQELQPRYEKVAKAAAEFGISQATATTGLARATVLTGNAAAAQRAYQEALVISKATGKDFNVALTATSKAQEGITTSLRRYGILVTPAMKGTEQLALVMKRFGGQAAANTTELDKLGANATNAAAALGRGLLPAFNKIVSGLSAWLSKMTESGRLQKDVTEIVTDASAAFSVLGDVIGGVDKVTRSFANTAKIVLALTFASKAATWVKSLELLAVKWGLVAGAADAATAAEGRALAGGALAGGTLAGAAGAAGIAGTESRAASGVILPAGVSAGVEKTGVAAVAARTKVLALSSSLLALGAISIAPIVIPIVLKKEDSVRDKLTHHLGGRAGNILSDLILPTSLKDFTGVSLVEDIFGGGSRNKPIPLFFDPQFLKFGGNRFAAPGFQGLFPARTKEQLGPFGTAKPQQQFTQKFDLSGRENLAQAQAQLTKTTADDVRSAKQIAARIKRLIDQGRLHGQALIQALGLEASALSTIWSAEDAAAQKRAQKAQAAKERIQRQLENSIDPLKLEIALSRAEAFGKPILPRLRALLHAAQAALAKGLTGALEKQALDQIASLKQQIKDAATTATVTFVPSAKLQLALAKDEALGRSPVNDLLRLRAAILKFIRTHKHNTAALIDAYQQLGAVTQQLAQSFTLSPKLQLALARDEALGLDSTKDLLKAKAAILKFIRTHRKNIAALTDAYQQLAAINQQLGSTASSALGLFKQASTRALTEGLGLTAAQRKALRERLSQLGPGGTVPGSGVGAAGFAIDPNTGRPLVLNDRRRSGRGDGTGGSGSGKIKVENKIDLNVYIDGKHVEATVTKRQQRRKRRNPSQRRGANAGGG